jgi:long-chain fatty acid transport protein
LTRRAFTPKAIGLAVVLAGASFSETSRADAVGTFGLGSRGAALGSAVAADVTDFTASYYNPSGLARSSAFQLTLGYEHATPKLELNGRPDEIEDMSAFTGGLVVPGTLAGLPVAFGLAAHVPRKHLSRVVSLRADEPRYIFFDNRPQQLHLSLGVAVRPASWLTVGAGLGFLAGTHGGFSIEGTAVQPLAGRSEYDSQLRHEIDAELQSVRYPILGVTALLSKSTSVAAVYRGQARVQLQLEASLQGTLDYTLLQIPAYYQVLSTTVSSFIPRQFVIAVHHDPIDELGVELDLSFVEWSEFQSAVSLSSSTLDVDVPPGLPLQVPTTAAPSVRRDPEFSDVLVPRLGIEYRGVKHASWQLPLRAGYSFQFSPVADTQPSTLFIDVDRHLISTGVGLVLERRSGTLIGDLRLDAHGFVMLPVSRTIAQVGGPAVTADGLIVGAGLNATAALW